MSEATEEKKELALVTLPVEKQDLEVALLSDKFIEELLDGVRHSAGSVVGDLKTVKGRGVYITMADKVRKSKAAFEVRAKDLVAELKARPALIDANRKRFRDEMDKIAVAIRQPVTDWEAEQERLKQEEEARLAAEAYALMRDEADSMNAAFDAAKAEALRKQIETDHEMALLMNDAFDRDREEKLRLAEQAQRERDERLQREAAEKAQREAEEKHRAELEAAARREAEARAATERAEREAREAQERTARLAQEARERAEREKQEAIADEQRKAQEEAARIKREADQREAARLAEEKRIADELAARQADVNHRKTVGTAIVNALTAHTSLTREQAIEVLTVLKDDLIPRVEINY